METMDGHRSKWPWDMAGDRHSAEIALPSVGIDAIGRDLGEILDATQERVRWRQMEISGSAIGISDRDH